ncbi:hypothetical protein ABEB36_011456 [Hypothenemus hampei]|uniref:Uncharacterized protein n=1 Tax=Hypothenemus hampei TaxID=57062 RepID=A0ABD1EFI5_HYPHA
MCFDIRVKELTTKKLKEILNCIYHLISSGRFMEQYPDQGEYLKMNKIKILKELMFRFVLNQTGEQVNHVHIKCSSESSLEEGRLFRNCSLDRRPRRVLRNATPKESRSRRSKSMSDLRTGINDVDLPDVLLRCKEHNACVKAELKKMKQERVQYFNEELPPAISHINIETLHSYDDYVDFESAGFSNNIDYEDAIYAYIINQEPIAGPSGIQSNRAASNQRNSSEKGQEDIDMDEYSD